MRAERVARRVARRQCRRDRPVRQPGQVDRRAHRRPLDNVHHHIVGAVAERDRAIVVGFKPVDRELHCPGISFADVGKGKQNRGCSSRS